MKRFVAACISLSLVLVSAPPASWAQMHSTVAGSATLGSSKAAGAAAGAARVGIPILPASALSLTGSSMNAASLVPATAPLVSGAPRAASATTTAVKADAKSLARVRREVSQAVAAVEKAPAEGASAMGTRVMDQVLGVEGSLALSSIQDVSVGHSTARLASSIRSRNLRAVHGQPPSVVLASARATNKATPHRGLWQWIVGHLRVLQDEEHNRQFWKLILGQAAIALGQSFHYTALTDLVAPKKEDAAKLGYNRSINWSAQGAASLTTGPLIDRMSTQKILVWTNVGRSALMLAVPLLFHFGLLSFGAFAAVIAVAGFLQMMGSTAGAVTFNRILAKNEAEYNRANAISTIVMNAVGVIGPLAAGAFIAWMDGAVGLLFGNAWSYAVYGVLLLATGVAWLFSKFPNDEMLQAKRELDEKLKRDGVGPVRYRDVVGGQVDGRKTLFVEVDGDPALATGVPAAFGGFPVKVVAHRNIFKEVIEGFKTVFADRFLRLYLLASTLAIASGDALIFAALPRFLKDVLLAGTGSLGLFLSAAALGAGIGSALMAFLRSKGKRAPSHDSRGGMDQMQRQGRWSSWLHGLSWLVYAGVFFTGSLYGSVALMFLSALLAAPEGVAWSGLLTRVVAGRYPESQGKIYAAISLHQMLCAVIGMLLYGWLMSTLATVTVLWIVAGVLVLCALIDVICTHWFFPMGRKL